MSHFDPPCEFICEESEEDLVSIALVPGGRWVVTGHVGGSLKVWKLDADASVSGMMMPNLTLDHSICLEEFGSRGKIGVLLMQKSEDMDGIVVLTESSDVSHL